MTTGTGLVLLGVWITCAACWNSKQVTPIGAILMTLIAIGLTVWLK